MQRQEQWLCTAMAALESLPNSAPERSHAKHYKPVKCPDKTC